MLARLAFPSQGKGFRPDRSASICLNAISKILCFAPKMARQRQTSCEAGAQSRGPLVGSRAAERRRSDSRMCHPRGRRDSSRLGREISLVRKSILFLPATVPGPVRRIRGGTSSPGRTHPCERHGVPRAAATPDSIRAGATWRERGGCAPVPGVHGRVRRSPLHTPDPRVGSMDS